MIDLSVGAGHGRTMASEREALVHGVKAKPATKLLGWTTLGWMEKRDSRYRRIASMMPASGFAPSPTTSDVL